MVHTCGEYGKSTNSKNTSSGDSNSDRQKTDFLIVPKKEQQISRSFICPRKLDTFCCDITLDIAGGWLDT